VSTNEPGVRVVRDATRAPQLSGAEVVGAAYDDGASVHAGISSFVQDITGHPTTSLAEVVRAANR